MKLMEIYRDTQWIDESLLDEDYPTAWDAEEFKNLSSFAARMRYAKTNLQQIAAGSGRVVYKIDDERVLKLSKNKKGMAQTMTEIDWGQDSYLAKSEILAKIFSFDENGLWVEMELARKLTSSKFKQIIGVDFEVYGNWLNGASQHHTRRVGMGFWKIPEDVQDFLWANEFTNSVVTAMNDYGMPAGDLGRISSYGIVRDDEIVIVDYGLSGDVYDTYYS